MSTANGSKPSRSLQLVGDLEAELLELQGELESRETTINNLTTQLAIAEANVQAARAEASERVARAEAGLSAADNKASAAQALQRAAEQRVRELKVEIKELKQEIADLRVRLENTQTTALAKREGAVVEQRSTAVKHTTATVVSLTLLGLQVLGIMTLTTDLFIGVAFAILMSIGVDVASLRELLDFFKKR